MSTKYKVGEDAIPHFVTFTVVDWIDVITSWLFHHFSSAEENKE